MSTEEEELGEGFKAATIAHIERVLVEENQRLRQHNRRLMLDNHELSIQVRTAPRVGEELATMRSALASVSWAVDLEEAHQIVHEALGYSST